MVIVGMAVLGVDLARLSVTAGETQIAADAGAVAYARRMLDNRIDGGSENPVPYANGVVAENSIDGQEATMADLQYDVGRFDFETRSFQRGGMPGNAVRAEGTADIRNIFAGVFGSHTSSVTRAAVAAFSGVTSIQATLPIAVGECYFEQFRRTDLCSDLPVLTQVPDDSDNSCWTSLGEDSASAKEAASMMPAQCCHGGKCGDGELPPPLSIGDQINIINGQVTDILMLLDDCVDQGLTEFVIPIIECGRCVQSMEVIGFATIDIAEVRSTGGNKGIDLNAICATSGGGTGGGIDDNFGMMTVSLVE